MWCRATYDAGGRPVRSAAAMVARSQARRRLTGLVLVGLLAALVSGAVLAAVPGARRTESTLDRFQTWSSSADIYVQTYSAEQLPDLLAAVRADPGVVAATERHLV